MSVSYSSEFYRYRGNTSASVFRLLYKCNWHLGLALMFVISAHKLRHGYLWDTANFILSWLKRELVLPRAQKKDRGLSSVTGSQEASSAKFTFQPLFCQKRRLVWRRGGRWRRKAEPSRCWWRGFKSTVPSFTAQRYNFLSFIRMIKGLYIVFHTASLSARLAVCNGPTCQMASVQILFISLIHLGTSPLKKGKPKFILWRTLSGIIYLKKTVT